jgi:hypothetical protein
MGPIFQKIRLDNTIVYKIGVKIISCIILNQLIFVFDAYEYKLLQNNKKYPRICQVLEKFILNILIQLYHRLNNNGFFSLIICFKELMSKLVVLHVDLLFIKMQDALILVSNHVHHNIILDRLIFPV